MSQQEEMKNLTLLGSKETPYIFEYSPQVLESFDNRHADNDYFIKFNCPEFTSLCPITGQPDFASIYISYIPDQLCVESKSLKLYLFSLRFGVNLLLVVVFQLTPITTMVVQKQNMKIWPSNVFLIMIYILKTLIIVNLMMKVLMRIMDFFLVKK